MRGSLWQDGDCSVSVVNTQCIGAVMLRVVSAVSLLHVINVYMAALVAVRYIDHGAKMPKYGLFFLYMTPVAATAVAIASIVVFAVPSSLSRYPPLLWGWLGGITFGLIGTDAISLAIMQLSAPM